MESLSSAAKEPPKTFNTQNKPLQSNDPFCFQLENGCKSPPEKEAFSTYF